MSYDNIHHHTQKQMLMTGQFDKYMKTVQRVKTDNHNAKDVIDAMMSIAKMSHDTFCIVMDLYSDNFIETKSIEPNSNMYVDILRYMILNDEQFGHKYLIDNYVGIIVKLNICHSDNKKLCTDITKLCNKDVTEQIMKRGVRDGNILHMAVHFELYDVIKHFLENISHDTLSMVNL